MNETCRVEKILNKILNAFIFKYEHYGSLKILNTYQNHNTRSNKLRLYPIACTNGYQGHRISTFMYSDNTSTLDKESRAESFVTKIPGGDR